MSGRTALSENELQFITANSGFDRVQVLAWYEQFKEQCPELRMNREQFVSFYSQLIPGDSCAEEDFCSIVFEAFDSDKNGYVDFGILITVLVHFFLPVLLKDATLICSRRVSGRVLDTC